MSAAGEDAAAEGGQVAAGDRRAAATEVYRQSVAAGMPLAAAALAARFDRSPRWGRQVIADQVAATRGNGDHPFADEPGEGPSGPQAASRALRRVTTAAVALVALVAAAASYDHQRQLAELAGEEWRSWLLPLSVDGLVVAASMSLLSAKRAGRRAGVLPWLALLAGLGASLAANVAAAQPTLVGRLVAAWPPAALALSFELLLHQHDETGRGGRR